MRRWDLWGDRSTLLETGRFVRAEAEPDAGAVEEAQTVNAQTALTDADFADEAFVEADAASDAELEARHRVAADKGGRGCHERARRPAAAPRRPGRG
ncbi:hypothetical protein GCM10020254_31970 [Streptomyces goshikiensis]